MTLRSLSWRPFMITTPTSQTISRGKPHAYTSEPPQGPLFERASSVVGCVDLCGLSVAGLASVGRRWELGRCVGSSCGLSCGGGACLGALRGLAVWSWRLELQPR